MRQPQSSMTAGASHALIRKPSAAATMIATCWLADCQLT